MAYRELLLKIFYIQVLLLCVCILEFAGVMHMLFLKEKRQIHLERDLPYSHHFSMIAEILGARFSLSL